jgi:uncharacterized protein (DUF427 family)
MTVKSATATGDLLTLGLRQGSYLHSDRVEHMRRPTPLPPGPDQESVWDYPRPPLLEAFSRRVVVRFNGTEVASTTAAYRVLETSHPPTFYLPPQDVDTTLLRPAPGSSVCEWKGAARYWSIVVDGAVAESAAWSYPEPTHDFRTIAGYFSFYPALLECFVEGVRVMPQPGGFYGGWITPNIVGPFKGDPGTWGW